MSLCILILLPPPPDLSSYSSLSPHLYLPLPRISFGLWSHLRLLIHCFVSRSIERLSVRRSHCTPHPGPPPMSPQTADTQPAGKLAFYIPYWRASPLPPPFSPLWITFHLRTLNHMERKKMHGALMGFSKKPGNQGCFWEPTTKQPEKIGYQHKTQCEKKRGM